LPNNGTAHKSENAIVLYLADIGAAWPALPNRPRGAACSGCNSRAHRWTSGIDRDIDGRAWGKRRNPFRVASFGRFTCGPAQVLKTEWLAVLG